MIEVLVQNDPYRYVKMPDLLENGQPDYRIQKWKESSMVKNSWSLTQKKMMMKMMMEIS